MMIGICLVCLASVSGARQTETGYNNGSNQLAFSSIFDSGLVAANIIRDDRFAVGLTTDLRNIKAREFVFDPSSGRKLSELTWQSDHSAWLGAFFSVRPMPRLLLRAQASMPVLGNQSFMRDLDWTTNSLMPTRISEHESTELRHAYDWQIEGAATVFRSRWDIHPFSLNVFFSFSKTCHEWLANGGRFLYENGVAGEFSSHERTIGYRQEWTTPQIGLEVKQQFVLPQGRSLWLTARADWGFWGDFRSVDKHYRRKLTYVDEGSGVKSRRLALTVSWLFSRNAELVVLGAWQKFEQGKTKTSIFEFGEQDALVRLDDGGGASSEMTVVGFELRYRM